MPTSDQLQGYLRVFIAAAGGFVVSKGWLDATTTTAIGGGVVIILMAIWSHFTNSKNALIASVNAGDNGVHVVPTTVAPTQTVNQALK